MSTVQLEQFELQTSDGHVLCCDARMPSSGTNLPVVIVTHGFKGFKDWGFFPHVGTKLAQSGFYTIAFNFSHNGIEGHSDEFTRLDKFAENTFSREVDEFHSVVKNVMERNIPNGTSVNINQVGALGHSRGGGIVLLGGTASQHISCIATWASVSTFNRYSNDQIERWKRDGFIEAKNARTGQMMRLNATLLDDLEGNSEQLDILENVKSNRKPLLIVHGDVDLAVRVDSAHQLYDAANQEITTLELIPKTGHTFGAVHPFAGTNDGLEYVIDKTASFFHDQLS